MEYKTTLNRIYKTIGVYFLYSNEELIYIGKTRVLGQRIQASITERSAKHRKITSFSYYVTNNRSDAAILEMILIGIHKPILNSVFKYKETPKMFVSPINVSELRRIDIN